MVIPEPLTRGRWVLVGDERGAVMAALEWKLAAQIAEDESVVVRHVVAAGGHAANQCESHSSPASPEIASARAATAVRTATHSGHRRLMA